jgi:hypothetical protein
MKKYFRNIKNEQEKIVDIKLKYLKTKIYVKENQKLNFKK